MNNIKNWDDFNNINETWRQVKAWLKIPQILFESILNKLIDWVPRIGIEYDKYAAKIDTGLALNSSTLKDEPIKLKLSDIKNEKMRKTLTKMNFFSNWNVYSFDRENHDGRKPIYITKDEIKKGDKYFGGRISDRNIDKNYNNRRYLKKIGKTGTELLPEFYVVVALETDEHSKMKSERDIRYNKKKKQKLEKEVDKFIKEDMINSRSNIRWSTKPLIYHVVEADRVDLVQKMIDATIKLGDDPKEMIDIIIDSDGWETPIKYKGSPDYKTVLSFAKSEEMKKLLNKYID